MVRWNKHVEVLERQVLIGGPWNSAIDGKGLQYWTFTDSGPFVSEKFRLGHLWFRGNQGQNFDSGNS